LLKVDFMVSNIAEDKNRWKKGVVTYGYDGTTLVPLKLNADGELVVNIEASAINIGDVDIASSVLPTGAATSDKQLADGHNVTVDNEVGSGVYIRPGTSADFPLPTAQAALIGTLADAPASISADETALTLDSLISIAKAEKNISIDEALSLSNIDGKLLQGDRAKAASISVTPATDITDGRYIGDVVARGGFKRLKKELTIPGASGAYSALDCIAASTPSITTQNIPLAGRVVGGSGSIVRAVLKTDLLTWTGQVKMVVYDGSGPTAFIADHAAFDDKYADVANIVAVIDFTAFAKTATGAAGSLMKSVVEGINIPYECGAGVTDLYFQLFTPASSGVTPAASQKIYLNFGVIRD
jgi:hypothetical protein